MRNAIDTAVGTGWGSVALLKKLETENYNVIGIVTALDTKGVELLLRRF